MNYEDYEPETYYDKQERKHMELVGTWALAFLLFLVGCAAIGIILGAQSLARWLLGGG